VNRGIRAAACVAIAALAAAGCGGQSKQDKATSAVCSARADISKQVDQLSSMTATTVTADAVRKSLNAIAGDLKTIRDSQPDLNDARKQQIEQANSAFTAQVRSVAADLGKSLSLSGAKDQMTTALQQLADAYKSSFAKVDCSGVS
jgi:hypothetical protein